MTDNSPATDELIAHIEADIKNGTMGEHHVILSLIARIRAETAKNSGEVVAWELISNTNGSVCGSRDTEPQEWDEVYAAKMNAKWVKVATPATGTVVPSVANSRAEAIRECIAVVEPHTKHPSNGPSEFNNGWGHAARHIRNDLRALLQQEGE